MMSLPTDSELQRKRLRAALLFEEGRTQAEVARRVGVSRTTASRWAKRWLRGGYAELCEQERVGRSPRLTEKQLSDIERALLRGPMVHGFRSDLWTLPRITAVIFEKTGVRYHPGHVWRLLRKLGWERKKAATLVGRPDPGAVGRWVKIDRRGETFPVMRIGPGHSRGW